MRYIENTAHINANGVTTLRGVHQKKLMGKMLVKNVVKTVHNEKRKERTMRLINADALKEFVKEKCSYCTSFIGEEDVLAWIDNTPTIDPNELDLDIDYSIEYDKRPDGISNAKVTITRIKPRGIIACEKVDELDMLERMYTESSEDVNKVQTSAEPSDDDETQTCIKLHFDDKEPIKYFVKGDGDYVIHEIEELKNGNKKQVEFHSSNNIILTLKTNEFKCDIPSVESSDLISRADAIDVGNKIVEELSLSSIDWDDLKLWAKELFDALPSVDRPKGEWIAVEDDWENIYWECSNCEDAFYVEVGTPKSNNYNFCPNCGADMRGEK